MARSKYDSRRFIRLLILLVAGLFASAAYADTPVFINEIHYDNTGGDLDEGFEIAGPAGTDLSGWSVAHYTENGTVYRTTSLSGTIPDQATGFGAIFFAVGSNNMQNGPADGLALVDAGNNLVQFLSYEGTINATAGVANGETSEDIGVAESSGTPVGSSLQLIGFGDCYEDFTWTGPSPHTRGLINAAQTLVAPGPDLDCSTDDASDAVYDVWDHGDNGGSGFGAWSFTTTAFGNGAVNGHFTGNSTVNGNGDGNGDGDINTSDRALGLYANSGNTAGAVRTFNTPMSEGSTFSMDMDNGWIEPGGTVGFHLQNSSGEILMELFFTNGAISYIINDGAGVSLFTGLDFTDEGLSIKIIKGAGNLYDIEIIRKEGGSATFNGRSFATPSGGSVASQIFIYNSNAGVDSPRDAFFNSFEICHPLPECAITGIGAGEPSTCNPQTNTYSLDVEVSYENAPATGNLVVNDQSFAITSSPQIVTLTGLMSDGQVHGITASFSADPSCSLSVPEAYEAPASCFAVVINEVDADTPGSDAAEFVELFDGGLGNTPLDGLVLVFYNGGSTDASYRAIDLDGLSTNGDGYFVAGNSSVPGVQITFPGNGLQNGEDAVALYFGDATDFPNGTGITTDGLIDALVYDSDDSDDPELLALLNAGQPQINEDENDNSSNESMQRIANGTGGARNTSTYINIPPTPNAENMLPAPCEFTNLKDVDMSACDPLTGTYTAFIRVSYTGAPNSGTLDVGGQSFPILGSGQIVELTDLPATGTSFSLTASFSANPECTYTEDFAAPENCFDPPNVLINEVDADTDGTDDMEFVELFDGGVGNTDLSGLVLVLYNGNGDESYAAFDLDGYSTDANGYFVLGNPSVPGVDFVVDPGSSGAIQNGADAVALYVGDASDFPDDTPVTAASLIDALVYDTNDDDDNGLINVLTPGQPQVNEDGQGDKDGHSNQRIPNGSGGRLVTTTYTQIPPTPDALNIGPLDGLAHQYVLLANEDVEISAATAVDGSIHGNDDVDVNRGAPTVIDGSISAVDDIDINSDNLITGDVSAGDDLDNDGTVIGTAAGNALVDPIALPVLAAYSAGSDDVDVEDGDDIALPPGSYRDVVVERDGTLRLSTGEYFMDELEFGTDTRLIVDATAGEVIVNIVSDLEFGQRMVVSIVGNTTDKLTFNNLQSRSIEIGRESTVLGNIIASNANVRANSYVRFRGIICARDIIFNTGATLLGHASSQSFPKVRVVDDEAGTIAAAIPSEFDLQQNYPNPFNPSTTIAFSLPETNSVTLRIYNINGQLVRSLVSNTLDAGYHTFNWDGRSDNGTQVSSGIYIYRVVAGDYNATRRMILLK